MTLAPKKRTRLLRNKKAVALLGIALPLGLSLYIWRFDKWFVKVKMQSSIGIYTGDSPFKWRPAEGITNPVLTARDVTDVHAEIVADPFMVWENDTWYMFFEVVDQETKLGEIALATSSNGLKWRYKQVVLREPFTMSFPYVFKWQDTYYMLPETHQAKTIRLYKAECFPTKWSLSATPIQGMYVDPAIVRYHDKWWIFAASVVGNDKLNLFYSDDLNGSWIEHPASPVVSGNNRIARPGGRVIPYEDKLIRYPQDDSGFYGRAVRAVIIDKLTTTVYEEHEADPNPILKGTEEYFTWRTWNAKGMHTIDPHQLASGKWIACVDGFYKYHYWTWEPFRRWAYHSSVPRVSTLKKRCYVW